MSAMSAAGGAEGAWGAWGWSYEWEHVAKRGLGFKAFGEVGGTFFRHLSF